MNDKPSKVLVVEDDGLICLLLEDLLAELGCDVVGPATTAEAAERIALDQPVDFALLDVTLGLGASYGAAELLRARHIPFAFLTGHDTGRIREDMRGAPMLPKPINLDDLEQLLRRSKVLPPLP